MTTFGRRTGRTPLGRPNNAGMMQRANRQLEASASFQAQQYNNALMVDGPRFYFWHKHDGSLPCTCANAPGHGGVQAGEPNRTSFSALGSELYDLEDLDSVPLDGETDIKFADIRLDPSYQARRANVNEKLTETEGFEGIDDSELETTEDRTGLANFADPCGLFNAKTIDCPICLGTGYIDSWQLYGGARFVLDTTAVHNFSCTNTLLNEAENPTEIQPRKGGTVQWSFTLPFTWERVLKIGLFNGIDPIPMDQFEWTLTTRDQTLPFTLDALESLNNTGMGVIITVKFLKDLEFTHGEIIMAYRPPYFAQMPEVGQGYEQEFLDWNVNVSMELPTDAGISEGDYLTESKYGRVWKISTLTPRVTSGGVVFGQTADVRALHQFEKKASQLALFPSPEARAANPSQLASERARPEGPIWGGTEW